MIPATLFFRVFLLSAALWPPHPIHVALTTVEYHKDDEKFSVIFKIFFDDLEKIIAENYNVALKLGKPDENPQSIDWLQKYIQEHFRMVVNDTAELSPLLREKKMNEQAIWLYCDIPYAGILRTVTVTNTVMMDMYADQTDLVIFKYGTLEKGVRFYRKYYTETFTVAEKL